MTETLEGLNNLFANELPACQPLSQAYVEKAAVIADELIKRSLVVTWPLLEEDPSQNFRVLARVFPVCT